MPFFCYNKKDYCDHSENCDGCDVWVIGKGGKEVPSNADRIRAMSDEELAKFLDECENKGYVDSSVALDNHGKMLPMLEWLKQPAEGDVNNG